MPEQQDKLESLWGDIKPRIYDLSPEQTALLAAKVTAIAHEQCMLDQFKDYFLQRYKEYVKTDDDASYASAKLEELRSGETPIDVLYQDWEGTRILSAEFMPGVYKGVVEETANARTLRELIVRLDPWRRLLTPDFEPQTGGVTVSGPRVTTPSDFLSGKLGEEMAVSFADGALSVMQAVVEPSADWVDRP